MLLVFLSTNPKRVLSIKQQPPQLTTVVVGSLCLFIGTPTVPSISEVLLGVSFGFPF